jgi:hypothetical protein
MFKAPIKVLHPLLTATQEGNYIGTETLGPIPFSGIILAHSNEAEWQLFKSNKHNEAFLDRICVITVPYCLRVIEETKIYKKLLRESELDAAPCAPETLEMLARFCVLTRLKEHENSNLFSKMRVYDGEKLRDTDPKAKTLQEYKDAAGVDEGMTGISTRFAYKALSETFNYDHSEITADPVHLMFVVEQAIKREQFPDDTEKKYLEFIKAELAPRYAEFIGKEIQKAYLESYGEYGRTCSTVTSPMPMPGSKTRTTRTPIPASCSTATRSMPSCRRSRSLPASPIRRLPQRGREVCASLPRAARQQKPRLDRLREDQERDRKADVHPGRGSASRDLVRVEEGYRDRDQA